MISPYSFTPITEELVSPVQFFPGRGTSGEKRLLLAVLEEAISCLYSPLPRGNWGRARVLKLRADAREWILSDETHRIFAFASICAALDYDARTLRAAVLREGFKLHTQGFRNNQVAGPPPKIGTKELLDDLDSAVQQHRRKKERAWPRRGALASGWT